MQRFLLPVLTLLIVACSGGGEDPAAHSFRVYTENGVRIAETTGGPKYSSELFAYEHVLTLEQDPRREGSLLGRPLSGSLMDEDGAIYIREMAPNRIACFDAEGKYSHDIGQGGQGPGEYSGQPELLSVRNGIVTIFDRTLARISRFRTDGTFLESHTASYLTRRFSLEEFHRTPEGNFIGFETISPRRINEHIYSHKIITILSADFDTLAQIETERVKGMYGREDGGHAYRFFNGYPDAVYHPEYGIYVTIGEEPVIRIYNLLGSLQSLIRLDIPPEKVSSNEIAAFRRAIHGMEESPVKTDMLDRLPDITFCDPKAYWDDIMVEENGYIWASLPTYGYQFWTQPGEMEHCYRIFSPEGEYLGETTLPHRGSISRGHLITFDVNDETQLIECDIYRIRPVLEGLLYPEGN